MSAAGEAREVLVNALLGMRGLALRVGGTDEELADARAGLEAAVQLGLAVRVNGTVTVMPEDPAPEAVEVAPSFVRDPTLTDVIEALGEVLADAKRDGYDAGQRALMRQALEKLEQVGNEDEDLLT